MMLISDATPIAYLQRPPCGQADRKPISDHNRRRAPRISVGPHPGGIDRSRQRSGKPAPLRPEGTTRHGGTNRCAEIRLRAERKLGQYLVGTPRNSGGRPKPVPLGNGFPTLDDLGMTRKLSHRAQRFAAIPDKDLDWYLAT